jgi:hypothetical protein
MWSWHLKLMRFNLLLCNMGRVKYYTSNIEVTKKGDWFLATGITTVLLRQAVRMSISIT